jgi:DNA-binding CsgD family transcriptional regulator
MKQLAVKPDVLFRFQKILLLSFGILFLGAVYILFEEVAAKLNWNKSAYVLLLIVLASFAVAFAWARIEYSKVLLLKDSLKTGEEVKATALQHKLDLLSFKEKTVLSLILAGNSNKEICAQLFIEHSTLKSHINHIYKKLDVKSRKELVLVVK